MGRELWRRVRVVNTVAAIFLDPDVATRPLSVLTLLTALAGTCYPAGAQQKTEILEAGGSRLHVVIEDTDFRLSERDIVDWIRRSVDVVVNYYARFPTERAYIGVRAVAGSGVKSGNALRHGPTININMGIESTFNDLEVDWVLIHELVHLAFPRVPDRHHWIEEGLAVYVESVARANVGALTPQQVWLGFVRGMPYGLPRAGDRGLDFTPTWGRIYWGGALFCLLADIDIRNRSGGKMTLRDALRGVINAGLDMTDQVDSLSSVLAVADTATGTRALTTLYERMKGSSDAVDLSALWDQLGIDVRQQELRFDDGAPLAAVRAAITAGDHTRAAERHYKDFIY
jgi:hypothetical protein